MTRVAVTTTIEAAPRLVWVLASADLEPVVLPCIEVSAIPEPELDAVRRAAETADWLVFTSRRAIDLLWPNGGIPAVPTAAVGGSTAEAIESAGGSVHVHGAGGAADLLAALLPLVQDRRVVFPHARRSDPSVREALGGVAADLTAVAVYDTRSLAPAPEPAVEAVLFGSPSAVAGWTSARTLDGLVVGALGTSTAAALDQHGHPPDVIPDTPRFEALAEALADHFTSIARRNR